MSEAECDVPVPGIFHFFGGIGTGIGKKVSVSVSVKILVSSFSSEVDNS